MITVCVCVWLLLLFSALRTACILNFFLLLPFLILSLPLAGKHMAVSTSQLSKSGNVPRSSSKYKPTPCNRRGLLSPPPVRCRHTRARTKTSVFFGVSIPSNLSPCATCPKVPGLSLSFSLSPPPSPSVSFVLHLIYSLAADPDQIKSSLSFCCWHYGIAQSWTERKLGMPKALVFPIKSSQVAPAEAVESE